MFDVASQNRRLGIALEASFDIRESFDSRSHRSESRWLFERKL